jgi:hypothetical protein
LDEQIDLMQIQRDLRSCPQEVQPDVRLNWLRKTEKVPLTLVENSRRPITFGKRPPINATSNPFSASGEAGPAWLLLPQ